MPKIEDQEIYASLSRDWPMAKFENATEDSLLHVLAYSVNELIKSDFHRLMSILYRIDVSEKKLRQLIGTHKGTDAATIIAHLIIEREKQKIRTKKGFPERSSDIPEDEIW